MPQSLSYLLTHIVFSTKDRAPVLDATVRPALHAYLATVARNVDCECFRVGGVADHVHLAVRLSRTITMAKLIEELKTSMSGTDYSTPPNFMTDTNQKQLGNTLWSIADQLRGAMDADDFRDYMLSFLFLRYLSDNYETAAKKELGRDFPDVGGDARKVPLALWYENNVDDVPEFDTYQNRT